MITKLLKTRSLLPAFLILLAACAPAAQPTAEPAPATEVPTTAPTDTPPPAPTATAEAGPTATAEPAPTETQPAELTEADLVAAVLASGEPAVLQSLASPDGLWLAEVLRADCALVLPDQQIAYEELRLTGPDGEHEVTHRLIYCGGLGAFGLNLLIWSEDSRNFYFDDAREGVPDGLVCGNWFRGMTRIDVVTLESEPLPGDGPLLRDSSAFLLWGGTDWIRWDLSAGEVARSTSPELDKLPVSMALSEDSNWVVYVLRSDCVSPDEDATIVLLDLATMEHTILLESEDPGFVSVFWASADVIVLVDPAGAEYTYAISTGTLTPPDY